LHVSSWSSTLSFVPTNSQPKRKHDADNSCTAVL